MNIMQDISTNDLKAELDRRIKEDRDKICGHYEVIEDVYMMDANIFGIIESHDICFSPKEVNRFKDQLFYKKFAVGDRFEAKNIAGLHNKLLTIYFRKTKVTIFLNQIDKFVKKVNPTKIIKIKPANSEKVSVVSQGQVIGEQG